MEKIGEQFGNEEIPDFFNFVKKYSNNQQIILDVGCGSGEFTTSLVNLFKKVIGIDNMPAYIKTAKKELDVKNVEFILSDCKDLPFSDSYFDVVVSLRGPLSSDQETINECCRVLKKGGFLIEETIGELDKLELKEIFKRGQNYPIDKIKLESISKLSDKANFQIIEHKYFKFYTSYKNINDVIGLLERSPIIDDFNREIDKEKLFVVENKLSTDEGIILSNHRLLWAGRKK